VKTRIFVVGLAAVLSTAWFYVYAGRVSAQSGGIEAVNVERYGSSDVYTYAIGHLFFGGESPSAVTQIPAPVPGTSRIIHTSASQIGYTAILESGDVYGWTGGFDSTVGAWQLLGNVLGTPTSESKESWGAIKGRYR
jgi:hypothetical protein